LLDCTAGCCQQLHPVAIDLFENHLCVHTCCAFTRHEKVEPRLPSCLIQVATSTLLHVTASERPACNLPLAVPALATSPTAPTTLSTTNAPIVQPPLHTWRHAPPTCCSANPRAKLVLSRNGRGTRNAPLPNTNAMSVHRSPQYMEHIACDPPKHAQLFPFAPALRTARPTAQTCTCSAPL
jgi:hypothetical protein